MELKDISLAKLRGTFDLDDSAFEKRLLNSNILPKIYLWILKSLKEGNTKVINTNMLKSFCQKDINQCRSYLKFFEDFKVIKVCGKNGKIKYFRINPEHDYKYYIDLLEEKGLIENE